MSPEADDFGPDVRRDPKPGKILPFPRRAPDWLTGPAAGLDAASDPHDDTTDEAPLETLPQPVLHRPGLPAPTPEFVLDDEPGAGGAEPANAEPAGAVPAPDPPRRIAPPGVWAPVASSVPALRLTLPVEPEPEDSVPAAAPPTRLRGLPGRDEDLSRAAAVTPALPALQEPWWVIALDSLRTSRSVQIASAAGLVGLVAVACWLWPRGVGTTSLSELRRSPAHFDGRAVVVRGRVGDDVFAVGAGWAFYLVQGRDTIVTFTRSQMPKPHDVVTMKGQVSTGFLDGVPRQALFEDTASAQ